jgi:hypothetical protein
MTEQTGVEVMGLLRSTTLMGEIEQIALEAQPNLDGKQPTLVQLGRFSISLTMRNTDAASVEDGESTDVLERVQTLSISETKDPEIEHSSPVAEIHREENGNLVATGTYRRFGYFGKEQEGGLTTLAQYRLGSALQRERHRRDREQDESGLDWVLNRRSISALAGLAITALITAGFYSRYGMSEENTGVLYQSAPHFSVAALFGAIANLINEARNGGERDPPAKVAEKTIKAGRSLAVVNFVFELADSSSLWDKSGVLSDSFRDTFFAAAGGSFGYLMVALIGGIGVQVTERLADKKIIQNES